MSLALRHKKGAFKVSGNLLPVAGGLWRSRPGATQLARGPVDAAIEWDHRLLFQRNGRLFVWDAYEHDVGGAGRTLDGAAFQALTESAEREDRLYIGDGVNPLFYIRRGPSGYERKTFANEVRDGRGNPYPVPIASAVEVARNRLWVAHGTNRAQHSDFEKPHAFDPLFTQEFQGGERGAVLALYAHLDYLAAGTQSGLWAVVGDSQFNFRRDPLVAHGVTGPAALHSDGQRLFFVSRAGAHALADAGTIGDDALDAAFESPDPAAQVLLSPDGRHLLLVVRSRLFVIHLDSKRIGEIAENVTGAFRFGPQIGWYGADGVWICNRLDSYDGALSGARTRVATAVETWPDTPPRTALLERSFAELRGEADAPITYTATVRTEDSAVQTVQRTMRGAVGNAPFETFWDGVVVNWEAEPLHHELPVMLAGKSFKHRLECAGHFELMSFTPKYRGN